MSSTSTSQPDPAGRDNGRDQAGPIGVTQTSSSNVATASKRNATAGEQSVSRAAAPAAPVRDCGDDKSANKNLHPTRYTADCTLTHSFPKARATWQSMPRSDDARSEARTIAAEKRYLYALNLHKNCPYLPPVEDIVKGLEEVQDELKNAHLDMQMPCTMKNTERCWVLDNLHTVNHILMRANIEIKETEPRRLGIHTIDPDQRPALSNASALLKACILQDVLFKGHRCVQELCLGPEFVDTWCALILRVSVASNESIRCVTVEGLYSRIYAPGHPLIDSICEMPALESLSITGLFLGARTVARIGAMIANAKSLRSVKFTGNDVPQGAGEKLMNGLCQNTNLEAVWLSCTAIGNGGARFLGDYLATTSKLRDLSLISSGEFHEELMSSITEGLKTNRGLEKLQIGGVRLAPDSMVSLAKVLNSHETLKYLTMTCCHLAEAETNSFADLLECNARLLGLDLSCNAINNIGAMVIARSLKFNGSLQKLDLSKNPITYQGAVLLLDALANNRVLKDLMLPHVRDDRNERPPRISFKSYSRSRPRAALLRQRR